MREDKKYEKDDVHPFSFASIDAQKIGWHLDRLTKEQRDISVALFELVKVLKDNQQGKRSY